MTPEQKFKEWALDPNGGKWSTDPTLDQTFSNMRNCKIWEDEERAFLAGMEADREAEPSTEQIIELLTKLVDKMKNGNSDESVRAMKQSEYLVSKISRLIKEISHAKENEISPIDGLNNKQFEKIREQIVEYIKMYRTDGEAIAAYKIMKLFEPSRSLTERKLL